MKKDRLIKFFHVLFFKVVHRQPRFIAVGMVVTQGFNTGLSRLCP